MRSGTPVGPALNSRFHPRHPIRIRLLGLILLAGCARPMPRPIGYGEEACSHCHMTVVDPRFAAELVTRTGRVYVFDDVGCLAGYYVDRQVEPSQVHSLWVNDFTHPDRLLDATAAVFLQTDSLRTPMASGLAALRPGAAADSLRARLGGRLLTWEQVLDRARQASGTHPGRAGTGPGPQSGAPG